MAEALRLAAELDQYLYSVPAHPLCTDAAAELRRLHKENELLASAADKLRMVWRDEVHCLMQDKRQLIAQRDALLEALRKIGQYTGEGPTYSTPWQDIVADLGQTARAAIKAVEEGK